MLARVSYQSSENDESDVGDCGLDVTSNLDIDNSHPIDQFFDAPIGGGSGYKSALTPDQVQGDYVLQGVAQLNSPGYVRVECLQVFEAPSGVVLATLSAIQAAAVVQEVTHG